jgi:hypothetical protein
MKGILAFTAAGGVAAVLALALFALADSRPAGATHVEGVGHVFVNNPPGQAVPIRDVTPPGQAVPIRDVMRYTPPSGKACLFAASTGNDLAFNASGFYG